MKNLKTGVFSICLLFICSAKAQNGNTAVMQSDSTFVYMDSLYRELPEVMVKGERPIAKVEHGKLVYDLPRLIEQHPADNAYEVLTKLPGIREQDDVLMLANKTITVILNGKVSTLTYAQLTERLKTIPASQVAKAEVMFTAPARYQVRGAAINLITKDNVGINQATGQLQSSWIQAHNAAFKESGNFIFSRKKFSLDLYYGYGYGKSFGEVEKEAYHALASETVHLNLRNKAFLKSVVHDYRAGFDYAFTPKHRLSLVYTGKWESGRNHNAASGDDQSDLRSCRHEYLHNAKLDYELPFGLKAGTEYTYFDNPENQTLDGKLNGQERDVLSTSGQRINKWLFYAAQEHTLKNDWSLNYGAKLNLTSNKSYQSCTDFSGNILPEASSRVDIRERIFNLYGGFSKNLGKTLSVDASLAAELYHTELWNEWNVFPTLNATWQPSDNHTFQVSFDSDKTYPSYWSTLSSVYYSSAYTEIQGNPQLRPARSYQLSLNYILKGKYTFALFWNENPDYFVQLSYQPKDRLAMVMKETNFDFSRQIGAQVSALFKFGNAISGNAFVMGQYNRDKSDNFFDVPFDRSKFTCIAGGTATVRLSNKPNILWTLNPFYQSPAVQGIYDIRSIFRLNTRLQWNSADKRLSVSAFLRNAFNSNMSTKVDYEGQWSTMKIMGDRRTFTLSVIYRLGNYKDKKREAVDMSRMGGK